MKQRIPMAIAPGTGGGRIEQGEEARGARPRPARRPSNSTSASPGSRPALGIRSASIQP